MNTVLLVDDARSFLTSVKAGLKNYYSQINVLTAFNGRQAVRILHSVKVDLVVTDLQMPEMDGFELISYMSRNYADVFVIAMTAFNTPELDKRLGKMGAIPLLEKPITFDDLAVKISELLDSGAMGHVQSFSLEGFLQLIEIEQKTMTLNVRSDGRSGRLYVRNGSLIDAETPDLKGYDAAIKIIGWKKPGIDMQERCKRTKRVINTPLMKILMESNKEKDESEKNGGVDSDLLRKAIRRAEGNHFKEARKLLAGFLKLHPRNYEGWLWHSRVTGNMTVIERSLINARKLAPSNPEVEKEIANFNLAQKRKCKGKLKRCPFCWSVIEFGTPVCPTCVAFLIVRRDRLAHIKNADAEELNASVQRYKRVVKREKDNISVLFYLGVAMLNLEKWTEGGDYLSKAARLSPKDAFLAEQLNTTLKFLASRSKVKTRMSVVKSPPPSMGRTILVVEDSSTTRMVITVALKGHGFRVLEAKNGIEALSLLNQELPDLIVLDLILPEMDGYQILSIVKKSPGFKNIPVIVLTAKDKFIDKLRGKLAGSDKYLTKPFDPEKLVGMVDGFLNNEHQ